MSGAIPDVDAADVYVDLTGGGRVYIETTMKKDLVAVPKRWSEHHEVLPDSRRVPAAWVDSPLIVMPTADFNSMLAAFNDSGERQPVHANYVQDGTLSKWWGGKSIMAKVHQIQERAAESGGLAVFSAEWKVGNRTESRLMITTVEEVETMAVLV